MQNNHFAARFPDEPKRPVTNSSSVPAVTSHRTRSKAQYQTDSSLQDMCDKIRKWYMPHPKAIEAAQQQHDQSIELAKKVGIPQAQIYKMFKHTQQLQETIPDFDRLVRLRNQNVHHFQTVYEATDLFKANPGLLSLESGKALTQEAETKFIEELRKQRPDSRVTHGENVSQEWPDLSVEENGQIESLPIAAQKIGLSTFLPDVNEFRLDEFINGLIMHPHFPLEDPDGLGWRIYRAISNLSKSTQVVPIQQEVYRARKYKEGKKKRFSIREMYGPPYNLAGQARFNQPGDSALYVCSNPQGTIREIRAVQKEQGSIYKFTLDVKLKILDMTEEKHILFDFCLQPTDDSSGYRSTHDEYALSNFVAGCCQKLGIQGIKYRSTLYGNCINYVFFDLPESCLNRHESGAFEYVGNDWEIRFS